MTKRRAHLPNKENVDTNTSGNGLTITKRHCRRNTGMNKVSLEERLTIEILVVDISFKMSLLWF